MPKTTKKPAASQSKSRGGGHSLRRSPLIFVLLLVFVAILTDAYAGGNLLNWANFIGENIVLSGNLTATNITTSILNVTATIRAATVNATSFIGGNLNLTGSIIAGNINNVYHVSKYATGRGNADSPYTNFETTLQTLLDKNNVTIIFDSGYYQFTSSQIQGTYKYGLKVHNSTQIQGEGNVWITQTAGLNLTAFFVNDGIDGSDTSLTYDVAFDNLKFIGNTNNTRCGYISGTEYGCGQAVAFYRSRNYRITNIYATDFSRYAAILFQGRNSLIDNIVCENADRQHAGDGTLYYYGNCIFLTGATPVSQHNIIGKVIGKNIENAIVLEDYPQYTSIGEVNVYNNTGSGVTLLDAQYVTIGSINAQLGARPFSMAQSSHHVSIGSIISNESKLQSIYGEVIKVNTYSDSHLSIDSVYISDSNKGINFVNGGHFYINYLSIANTTTGILLGNGASNFAVQYAEFDNVGTKVSAGGNNNNITIWERNNIIYGSLGSLSAGSTLVIDAANSRVGIGTASPAAQLHIASGNAGTIQLGGTNYYGKLEMNSSVLGGLKIISNWGAPTAGPITFNTGSNETERVRIAGGGNVGIGTTGPNEKLAVSGNLSTTGAAYFATSSGNVGIGTTSPQSLLHVNSTTSNVYIQLPVNATILASSDCNVGIQAGKMIYDTVNNNLYLCGGTSGWRKVTTSAP